MASVLTRLQTPEHPLCYCDMPSMWHYQCPICLKYVCFNHVARANEDLFEVLYNRETAKMDDDANPILAEDVANNIQTLFNAFYMTRDAIISPFILYENKSVVLFGPPPYTCEKCYNLLQRQKETYETGLDNPA